ncbi:MAG: hypothetical protein WBB01_17790 [Phormidesmis sp.]
MQSIRLWAGWAALTWLAFLFSLLFIEIGEKGGVSVADGLLGGALLGFAQWRILRPYLRHGHRWIIANLLGCGVLALLPVGLIGWIAPGTTSLWLRGLSGIFYGAYAGLVLGASQWAVLRHQVADAWRWIPLSAGTWAVAIALGWLIGGELRAASHLFVSEVVGLIVAWAAISALSGLAITWLLCKHHPS